MCRSVAGNEKNGIIAIGGSASKLGKLSLRPFISLHRLDKKATFPVLDTIIFDQIDGCISSLEFMHLAKKTTLLACDARCLMILEFTLGEISLLKTVKVHDCKEFVFLNFFSGCECFGLS